MARAVRPEEADFLMCTLFGRVFWLLAPTGPGVEVEVEEEVDAEADVEVEDEEVDVLAVFGWLVLDFFSLLAEQAFW